MTYPIDENRELSVEDKLTRIKLHCQCMTTCKVCCLVIGLTCPAKLWKEWTTEETERAFEIICRETNGE